LYHRPHPQQSAGHRPLSRPLLHHINRQDIQVLLSVATRSDQVESINSWISGICKDYSVIIPLGVMHPDHQDPEAVVLFRADIGALCKIKPDTACAIFFAYKERWPEHHKLLILSYPLQKAWYFDWIYRMLTLQYIL